MGRDFIHPESLLRLCDTVNGAQLSPSLFEIELTEGVLMPDAEAGRRSLCSPHLKAPATSKPYKRDATLLRRVSRRIRQLHGAPRTGPGVDLEELGDAEIEQLDDDIGGREDVERIEVAVHDPVSVGVPARRRPCHRARVRRR